LHLGGGGKGSAEEQKPVVQTKEKPRQKRKNSESDGWVQNAGGGPGR